MKYNEMLQLVAEKSEVDKETTQKVVGTLLDCISETLAKGEDVQLWGFGRFERRKYNARKCYNPLKGQLIDLKGSYSPVFKAGTKLRETLNK